MNEFLTFRRYITPIYIQVIFWIGLVLIFLVSVAFITFGAGLFGVLELILGLLLWRVVCEVLILLFRMDEKLRQIRDSTATLAGTKPWSMEPPAIAAGLASPAPASTPETPTAAQPPAPASAQASTIASIAPSAEPTTAAPPPRAGPELPAEERSPEATAPPPERRFCTSCGTANAATNWFCESCGNPLLA